MHIRTAKRFTQPVILLIVTVCATFVFAAAVSAHEGEDHAEMDLAGTPVSQIEAATNAVKNQKKQASGVTPGVARKLAVNGADSTLAPATVSSNPAAAGSWSSVLDTPLVPVFQAVLPNGKILAWDSVGDQAAEHTAVHKSTRAMVWDPLANAAKRVDVTDSNIFCAGFAHLPNGNILVAGGNKNEDLDGSVQTHIFNWQTETWSRGPDMAAGRWYPSVAKMANGEATIIGGGPAVPEVYQTNGILRRLTKFDNTTYGARIYPFMVSRPDTLLQLLGPYTTNYALNTAGRGLVISTSERDTKNRQYGSFATYDIGKTLITGGGSFTEDGKTNVPTKTTVIEDYSKGTTPTVTAAAPMSIGRRQHNATVLADGSVLLTGGLTSTKNNTGVDLDNAVTSAELWNPVTNSWTVQASASRIRQYHSAAALLPDGRVITGGGGICGTCETVGYLEKNFEYFTPSYLYKKDGSGQLADRPVISYAPASIGINAPFSFTSPQAGTIKKAALIGLADVTHSTDGGQRYIPLKYTVSGDQVSATGPATGGIAPPGYYMLVVVDASGVPSVAKILQVAKGPSPLMSPLKNVGANRCLDIYHASTASRTYLETYTCNDTEAQAVTRFPNDATIRLVGNCFDVYYAKYVSGTKVWSHTCNGSEAETWQFWTDGTIRPVAAPSLCLAASGTDNQADIVLKACSGSTLQKWQW